MKITDKKLIYISLCLGCITISFNVAAISAVLPLISLDLNLPDIVVSKIIPYYMVPYGIGALIYAPLTRNVKYGAVLASTMVLYSASCFLCGVTGKLFYILLFRVLMGITGAAAIPLGLMLIGEMFDKSVRGRLVGFFFGCSFFASLAGIGVSGLLDWRWIFYIPSVIGLVTCVCFLLLRKSDLLNQVHGVRVNYFTLYTNKYIRKIFIFIAIISALYHGVHKWYGVYFSREYGMDKAAISLFFIVSAVTGFLGQILGGYLSDKKGRGFSCFLGLFGLGAGIIFLSFGLNIYLLGVIVAVVSMSWTVGHNGISTVLTDFPDKDRPMIASLNSSVRFVSGGLGFYVSGLFVEKSFSGTFLFIGILTLILIYFLKYVLVFK